MFWYIYNNYNNKHNIIPFKKNNDSVSFMQIHILLVIVVLINQ